MGMHNKCQPHNLGPMTVNLRHQKATYNDKYINNSIFNEIINLFYYQFSLTASALSIGVKGSRTVENVMGRLDGHKGRRDGGRTKG